LEKIIFDKFVELLGDPSDESTLEKYIDFVLENKTDKISSELYCEDHHIIPRCIYANDLVYALTYTDHVEAHFLLSKAYPIRRFTRPLNFMLPKTTRESKEYRKIISTATKNAWIEFKKSPKYEDWREKRRNIARAQMLNGHSKNMSAIGNSPENRVKKSEQLKRWWIPERREQKSKDMIEYNIINGTQRYSDALNKRYSEMSESDFNNFKNTMKKINGSKEKKEQASKKLKSLWKNDEVFIEKMKNRKYRGSDGSAISELWKDPNYKERTLKSRKISHIRNKIPSDMIHLLEDLADDEIIKTYGKYSRKLNTKTPNTELAKRIEIKIIKAYKLKNKVSKDPLTDRGWYRTSIENLHNIIKIYCERYGMLNGYEHKIEEIINETD